MLYMMTWVDPGLVHLPAKAVKALKEYHDYQEEELNATLLVILIIRRSTHWSRQPGDTGQRVTCRRHVGGLISSFMVALTVASRTLVGD